MRKGHLVFAVALFSLIFLGVIFSQQLLSPDLVIEKGREKTGMFEDDLSLGNGFHDFFTAKRDTVCTGGTQNENNKIT